MAKLVRVAGIDEITPGTMKTFEAGEKLILLANVDGVIYAMDALCTHAEWDLSEGTLEDTKITCAGHGAVWDLTTGKAEFYEELPLNKIYKTIVKNGAVYVELD